MPSIAFKDIVSNCCERVDPSDEKNVPYIGLEHIGADSFTVPFLGNSQEVKGQKFKMKKGDVLFGRRRAYQKKVAIAPCDGIFSAHGMIFRPKPTIIRELLPFFIRSDAFMNKAISLSVGSLSPTLNWGAIKDVMFSIPKMESQSRIAELLWAIEEDIELINQQINQMDLLVKSRFIEMFGTSSNPKYGHVKVAELVSNKIVKVSKQYNSDDIIQYIDISSIAKESKTITGTTEYLVKDAPSRAQQCVQSGDILLSNVRPNLKTMAIVDSDEDNLVCSSGFTVLRCEKSEPEFLITAILDDHYTDELMKKANGSSYPAVTSKDVLNGLIPSAPIELQQSFSSFAKQVDKSKFELQKHFENTKRLQKALVNEAFKQ